MISRYVFCKAVNSSGVLDGDAANITGRVSKGDGSFTNLSGPPTAIGNGVYRFTLTYEQRRGYDHVFDFYSTTGGACIALLPENSTEIPAAAKSLDELVFAYYPGDDIGDYSYLDHVGGHHLRHGGASQGDGATFAAGSTTALEYDNSTTEFDLTEEFTIYVECKLDEAGDVICGHGDLSGDKCFRLLHSDGLSAILAMISVDGSSEVYAQVPYNVGETVRLLISYDGQTLVMQDLTNDTVDEVDLTGPLHKTSVPFRVGFVAGQNASQLLNGVVKDLLIFDHLLTSRQEYEIVSKDWRPQRLPKTDIDVVLFAGQSNLSGESADATQLTAAQISRIANPKNLIAGVKQKHVTAWSSVKLGVRSDVTEFGPDIAAAGRLPDGFAVYSHGISSTSLHTDWASGGSAWNAMVSGWADAKAELEKMGFRPRVAAFVFIQGEADSVVQVNADNYAANLIQFISDVRAEFGDVPFVVSRLSQVMIDNGAYPYGSTTKAAQTAVAAADPRVGLVDTDDGELEAGEINHFSASYLETLGYKLAAEAHRLIGTDRSRQREALLSLQSKAEAGDEMSLTTVAIEAVGDEILAGDGSKLMMDNGRASVLVDDKTGFELSAVYDNAKTAASQASVDALQTSIDGLAIGVNSQCVVKTSSAYERPSSGSDEYPITIRTTDSAGIAADADSTPVITASNVDGTDRSGKISSVQQISTGTYRAIYTVNNVDTLEALIISASAVIGGEPFSAVAHPVVTDAVAVDFTGADRTLLQNIASQSTEVHGWLDINGDVRMEIGARATQVTVDALTNFLEDLESGQRSVHTNLGSDSDMVAGFRHFFTVGTPGQTMNDVGSGSSSIDEESLVDALVAGLQDAGCCGGDGEPATTTTTSDGQPMATTTTTSSGSTPEPLQTVLSGHLCDEAPPITLSLRIQIPNQANPEILHGQSYYRVRYEIEAAENMPKEVFVQRQRERYFDPSAGGSEHGTVAKPLDLELVGTEAFNTMGRKRSAVTDILYAGLSEANKGTQAIKAALQQLVGDLAALYCLQDGGGFKFVSQFTTAATTTTTTSAGTTTTSAGTTTTTPAGTTTTPAGTTTTTDTPVQV